MLKDVWHVDLFPGMGDAQVAFEILSHCFVQWPLYILQYIFPSYTFIESFIPIDSSFLQMLGHLLTSQTCPLHVCVFLQHVNNVFKVKC
jgi:hypothetical protein